MSYLWVRIHVILKKSINHCSLHLKVSSNICHPCTVHTVEAQVQLPRFSCLDGFSPPGTPETKNWPVTCQSDCCSCKTYTMSVQVRTCYVFFDIPQAWCNLQWQDAVLRHRNPHRSHVITMAPETTNTGYNMNIGLFKFTFYIYCRTHNGLFSVIKIRIPTNTHDHLVNTPCW